MAVVVVVVITVIGGESLLSSLVVGSWRYGHHCHEVGTHGHCVTVVGDCRHWWRVVVVNYHCQKCYLGMKGINGTIEILGKIQTEGLFGSPVLSQLRRWPCNLMRPKLSSHRLDALVMTASQRAILDNKQ